MTYRCSNDFFGMRISHHFALTHHYSVTNQQFKMRWILIIICLSMTQSIYGQTINIQSISNNEGKVIMNFDLEDSDPDRRYTLRLYSSIDNYVQPLASVSGNIGVNQRVGGSKQVIWDAREELDPDFSDFVSLEIKAFIYIPFIEMEDLSEYGVFKRGKVYTLSWTGGRRDNILNFELLKDKKKTGVLFKNISNSGSWDMTLPKNTKPGNDYSFRIADHANSDEEVFSSTFSVKAKVPLVAKIAGGLIIGAVSVFIINENQKNKESEDIPLPGDPSRN
jgi:hypothetical protein